MAYVIKPCRGCGGPKDEAGKGIRYCFDCKLHMARLAESKKCRPSDAAGTDARTPKMAQLYKAGQTLQQIGDAYGITRERVRQLIKAVGLTRKHGGQARKTLETRAWVAERLMRRRDARTIKSHGCTYAELLAANDGKGAYVKKSLAVAYTQQRRNAEIRGIGWRFTFPEWVAVWEASGHLDERGRSGEAYVMARYSDAGPYSPANVYITTLRTNSRDYQMTRLGRKPSYVLSVDASANE